MNCGEVRYGVDTGAELLELAAGAETIAVIGTAKNVGKTTAAAALCAALREPFGVVSAGRDGEARDELDGRVKPRLFLAPGTLFATVRSLVPRHPACEIVSLTGERGALGEIAIARVRSAGYYEIAGPAGAPGLRRVVALLRQAGARRTIVDGALDRVAALRSGDAVVVATGAAAGASLRAALDPAVALVRKLQTAAFDSQQPHLEVDGALTSERVADLVRMDERRQVVVQDATRILARGAALDLLRVRVRNALQPIACTIASAAPQRTFEPAAMLRLLAGQTGLPAFDILAAARAA